MGAGGHGAWGALGPSHSWSRCACRGAGGKGEAHRPPRSTRSRLMRGEAWLHTQQLHKGEENAISSGRTGARTFKILSRMLGVNPLTWSESG